MPIATQRTLGSKRQRLSLWSTREAFYTDLGLFLLGAAGAYSISFVGQLPGDEILLFPFLPVLLASKGKRAFTRKYLWFYFWAAAWLLGTLISDLYNGSPTTNRLKGVARVVFFIFDFSALAVLLNNKNRRMVIFALSMVFVFLNISRYFVGDFLTQWKFGIASSVILVGLIIASHFYKQQRYWICTGIFMLLAAANLHYAFRSQIGLLLVTLVLVLPIFTQEKSTSDPRSLPRIYRVVGVVALAGGAVFLTSQLIKVAAARGFFSENTTEKFTAQSQGKLGVLFGGRPETLVAIQAIRDSPILGHGSFAVSQHYLELKRDIQYEYGYVDDDTPEDIKDPGIPTHSHLTMAWVESGVLGGILWIYILILTIRAIFEASLSRPPFAPLYCYLLVNFVWDILYSPFGSVNRLWAAYVILIAYGVLESPRTATAAAGIRRKSHSFLPTRLASRRDVAHWRPNPSQ